MIFFLDQSLPLELDYTVEAGAKNYVSRIRDRFFAPHGGALALQDNLKKELLLQKKYYWSHGKLASPKIEADVGWVLRSLHDLRHAILLKRRGRIRYLWAGPNMVVVPQEAESLLSAKEIDAYIVPCDWVANFYAKAAPYLEGKIHVWPVGINCEYWQDNFNRDKIQFIVYNKNQPELTRELSQDLTALNIPFKVIDYGKYTPSMYREALSQARGLLWLSQSETEGLACLEALSMNVPVCAWNPGTWSYQSRSLRGARFSASASSVPYFDASCGETFKTHSEFSATFEHFNRHLGRYEPRKWVLSQKLDLASNLSLLAPLQKL